MEQQNEKNKTIGYLRVSTASQEVEKNKMALLTFANDKGLQRVEFVEEHASGAIGWQKRPKLAGIVADLKPGDTILVPELSRLGRSLTNVLEVLDVISRKDVKVYSVKEGFQLNGNDMTSKMMRTLLGLFAELERDLHNARCAEGRAAAMAKGVKFGRPAGEPRGSKLDQHKDEIVELLELGVKKGKVAERFNCTPVTLWHWLKRNEIDI